MEGPAVLLFSQLLGTDETLDPSKTYRLSFAMKYRFLAGSGITAEDVPHLGISLYSSRSKNNLIGQLFPVCDADTDCVTNQNVWTTVGPFEVEPRQGVEMLRFGIESPNSLGRVYFDAFDLRVKET